MNDSLARMLLVRNPFDPVGSGAPSAGSIWLPVSWRSLLRDALDQLEQAGGARALAISAEYGGGKTYTLDWLTREELPARNITTFYFASIMLRQPFSTSLQRLPRVEVRLGGTIWRHPGRIVRPHAPPGFIHRYPRHAVPRYSPSNRSDRLR